MTEPCFQTGGLCLKHLKTIKSCFKSSLSLDGLHGFSSMPPNLGSTDSQHPINILAFEPSLSASAGSKPLHTPATRLDVPCPSLAVPSVAVDSACHAAAVPIPSTIFNPTRPITAMYIGFTGRDSQQRGNHRVSTELDSMGSMRRSVLWQGIQRARNGK